MRIIKAEEHSMRQAGRMLVKGALFMVAALALSACSLFGGDDSAQAADNNDRGGLFGGGGDDAEAGIGVNSYLWRASLDTLNFMPLSSVESSSPTGTRTRPRRTSASRRRCTSSTRAFAPTR
jgi:hypothetical protein